jgi:hypothetical protein
MNAFGSRFGSENGKTENKDEAETNSFTTHGITSCKDEQQ